MRYATRTTSEPRRRRMRQDEELVPRTRGPYATRQEAAAFLRLSVRSIDGLIAEGKLTRHQVADRQTTRLLWAEIEALVKPVVPSA